MNDWNDLYKAQVEQAKLQNNFQSILEPNREPEG
jgi:hypothetical protein